MCPTKMQMFIKNGILVLQKWLKRMACLEVTNATNNKKAGKEWSLPVFASQKSFTQTHDVGSASPD